MVRVKQSNQSYGFDNSNPHKKLMDQYIENKLGLSKLSKSVLSTFYVLMTNNCLIFVLLY